MSEIKLIHFLAHQHLQKTFMFNRSILTTLATLSVLILCFALKRNFLRFENSQNTVLNSPGFIKFLPIGYVIYIIYSIVSRSFPDILKLAYVIPIQKVVKGNLHPCYPHLQKYLKNVFTMN